MTDHAQQQLANGDRIFCDPRTVTQASGQQWVRAEVYDQLQQRLDQSMCETMEAERQCAKAQDLARAHEAEAWKCREEARDMTAQNGVLLAEVKRLESELAALRAKLQQARAACAAAVKVWEAGCVDRGWKDEPNWIDATRDQLDDVLESPDPTAAECGEGEGR